MITICFDSYIKEKKKKRAFSDLSVIRLGGGKKGMRKESVNMPEKDISKSKIN